MEFVALTTLDPYRPESVAVTSIPRSIKRGQYWCIATTPKARSFSA